MIAKSTWRSGVARWISATMSRAMLLRSTRSVRISVRVTRASFRRSSISVAIRWLAARTRCNESRPASPNWPAKSSSSIWLKPSMLRSGARRSWDTEYANASSSALTASSSAALRRMASLRCSSSCVRSATRCSNWLACCCSSCFCFSIRPSISLKASVSMPNSSAPNLGARTE